MGNWKVTLDRTGVGKILREGDVPKAVNALAEQVAANVNLPDNDGDVVVEPYTTDRGAAAVIVRHPRAVGLQAKYGLLTSAASQAGLSVRGGGR